MSYQVYITKGYGICVSDINTTKKRVMRLLNAVPETKKFVEDCVSDSGALNFFDDDFDLEWSCEGDYGECGLTSIVMSALKEKYGIEFIWADNYDGQDYVLYPPGYPWKLQKSEKRLTEDKLTEMFSWVVRFLQDVPLDIDYYSVENGG